MTTFIDDVVEDLLKQSVDISQTTIVLPSKRAGTFFLQSLAKQVKNTIFAPTVISIEEFVESVSGFRTLSNTELLFEFYEVYLDQTPQSQVESFESFSKWAQIILQDFNEIDRYLVPPDSIFEYLNAIKKIENQHWSIDEEQSDYIKNYLAFWNRLKSYYKGLQTKLLEQSTGYQGLVYKQAVSNLDQFITKHKNSFFVFAGFNALNTAEEKLITHLLEQDLASIYWDIDDVFLNDPVHDAGLFIRQHLKNWKYFETHRFNKFDNYYNNTKQIRSIGTAKNIGQVKYVGQLLEEMAATNESFEKTAVVLSDESLLIPLLNSLPKSIEAVNITMGLPLKDIPLAASFDKLFRLYTSNQAHLYYRDLLDIINDPFFKSLFKNDSVTKLSTYLKENNMVYVSLVELSNFMNDEKEILHLLFDHMRMSVRESITKFQHIILKLRDHNQDNTLQNQLNLEYLQRFHSIFNELLSMNEEFEHISSITTLYNLYKELLKSETLDFKGEPLEGLQIMGMLETRLLDFENVIITSVNEGILPAGKTNNSFIPFDVKVENGLPTFKEKDAVFTYHFYRLIQRAKRVDILYNTVPDVLGGAEKSRFITQLEFENIHKVLPVIASSKIPTTSKKLKSIHKTEAVLDRLKKVAFKGFSPSSLTSYIRNPMDFYEKRVLGIRDFEEVEESVAANTLGTVLHNTLEEFYKPLEGQLLSKAILLQMTEQLDVTVSKHFEAEFKAGDVTKGRNLIIFEIAKHYIQKFLETEIKTIEAGNSIKIIAIEVENNVAIDIPTLDFQINLTGKVDRVDELNGVTRIIDYKSGNVAPAQVKIDDWSLLLDSYKKYSKSIQLLMYAYMMAKTSLVTLPVEAGIISFKKMSHSVFKFEDKSEGQRANYLITNDTLEKFEHTLTELILEIFNSEVAFEEKEVE